VVMKPFDTEAQLTVTTHQFSVILFTIYKQRQILFPL
jgi:hypothetical protein